MSVPVKEVLLVGFGAVGAIYSLILKRSGLARVTAVARGNYEVGKAFISKAVNREKLTDGDQIVVFCNSVLEAADRPYDYVVVTTKAIPDVVKTSQILAPLLSSDYNAKFHQAIYVLLQNGLNVEVDLYNVLKTLSKGEPRIISTAVWIGTNLQAPNIVEHNDFDRVALGVYRHGDRTTTVNTAEESVLLHDFGDLLQAGGSTVTVLTEVQRMKFNKNFWNVAFSASATLTGYTLPAVFRPPPEDPSVTYEPFVYPATADLISSYTVTTLKAILEELISLGRALGYPDTPDGLPSSLVQSTIENTRKLHVKADSTHVPSMLLDARKGQPIEVEVILGEVVRMAKEHNVDVPRVETLYALLLVVQNQILRKTESGKR